LFATKSKERCTHTHTHTHTHILGSTDNLFIYPQLYTENVFLCAILDNQQKAFDKVSLFKHLKCFKHLKFSTSEGTVVMAAGGRGAVTVLLDYCLLTKILKPVHVDPARMVGN